MTCRGAEGEAEAERVEGGAGAEAVVALTGAVVIKVVGAMTGMVVGGGGARVTVEGAAVAVDWTVTGTVE